jgi:YD repeat-containing protein
MTDTNLQELSNDTLTNYKKAAANAPIAKGGDTTAGRILATARKRQKGVQAATKRLDERAEGLNEGVIDAVKGLFGASAAQKASRAHAERKALAAAARHADRKEKERQSSKPTNDVWGNHADTTVKKGAKVHEETQTEAVKIPAHDEMCGDIGQAPKTAEHVKLSTKGQLKMLAMVQKAKYATHTNVEVPGTQVKEGVEQIDELSNDTLGKYKKAAGADASAADKAGNFARGNKRFSGIVKATKKQFANDVKKESILISFKDFIKEGVSEAFVIESEELSEEFISHSDFEEKLKNHKNSGHVVHHDYDHSKKKAVIRHVDSEGEVRQYTYHDKGTKVERLAPIGNKHVTNDSGKSVTKHDAPGAEKRGRGRPAGKYGSYKKNK